MRGTDGQLTWALIGPTLALFCAVSLTGGGVYFTRATTKLQPFLITLRPLWPRPPTTYHTCVRNKECKPMRFHNDRCWAVTNNCVNRKIVKLLFFKNDSTRLGVNKSILTFTLVCVAQSFLCVQTDADVTRMSGGGVRAGPGALIVTATTGSGTLRPGGPAWPRPLHWKTRPAITRFPVTFLSNCMLMTSDMMSWCMFRRQTWTGLNVAVLIFDWRSAAGKRSAPPVRRGAGTLARAETLETLFRTRGPRFPRRPRGSLHSCDGSSHSEQVLNQTYRHVINHT